MHESERQMAHIRANVSNPEFDLIKAWEDVDRLNESIGRMIKTLRPQ